MQLVCLESGQRRLTDAQQLAIPLDKVADGSNERLHGSHLTVCATMISVSCSAMGVSNERRTGALGDPHMRYRENNTENRTVPAG